jgi:2-amino-4-hydroxy-6-hydroxymethyldihydropteridine diphosphokinase
MTSDPIFPVSVPVAVALGSNLGERERYLRDAIAALRQSLCGVAVSAFYDTEPVGVGEQPRFLNAAATGSTTLPPRQLLATLLDIEARFGRTRPHPGAARTLDLDLILYGDQIIEEWDLMVPHPRFRERRFVLEPLAEIAPDWIDPVTKRTMRELMGGLLPQPR